MKNILILIFALFLLPDLHAQNYHSDCSDAKLLCSTSTVEFQFLNGRGAVRNEVGPTDCYGGLFPENNGVWLQWEIGTPGELAFTITPKQDGDDLDFVLFQMPDQTFNCGAKQAIRCAVSGENQGRAPHTYSRCMGATGLRSSATDYAEKRGCFGNDDNFVAPVSARNGETYLLYINNYSSSNGFTVEFTGDAGFAAFSKETMLWDKEEVILVNKAVEFSSASLTGLESAQYDWSFGEHASPATATGAGPHLVTFNKAGAYEVEVSIKTNQGCSLSSMNLIEVQAVAQAPAAQKASPATDLFVSPIFPNPSADEAFIKINTPVSRTAIVLISDELGRQISRTEYELLAGQQQLALDLGKLQHTQTLFVNVQIGDEQFHRKLMYLRP